MSAIGLNANPYITASYFKAAAVSMNCECLLHDVKCMLKIRDFLPNLKLAFVNMHFDKH